MSHEEENDDELVVLTDDQGNDREYIFLAIVEVDGAEYAILTPNDDPESDEEPAEIFLFSYAEDEEGYEVFEDITDEAIYNKVKAKAQEVLNDMYEGEV